MTITRLVSAAVISSFLVTAVPKALWAKDEGNSSASVDLRAAIDRAAAQFVTDSRELSIAQPASRPAANAKQNAAAGAGGGGKGKMIFAVVGTLSSVATTY